MIKFKDFVETFKTIAINATNRSRIATEEEVDNYIEVDTEERIVHLYNADGDRTAFYFDGNDNLCWWE